MYGYKWVNSHQLYLKIETKGGKNKQRDRKNTTGTKQDGRRAVNHQKTGTLYLWIYLYLLLNAATYLSGQ